jgi:hypothetical protein
MIKIKKKEKGKTKVKPHYLLKFNYMIGDADGYTQEEVVLSLENPFIERFVTLLNGLKPPKGRWGIVLDEYEFGSYLHEGQLSKEDYDFLVNLMFENEDNIKSYNDYTDEEKYAEEFQDGVRGDAEYSFLVFKGCVLYYIDEYGEKHDTYFE